jgi:hypothetical protein
LYPKDLNSAILKKTRSFLGIQKGKNGSHKRKKIKIHHVLMSQMFFPEGWSLLLKPRSPSRSTGGNKLHFFRRQKKVYSLQLFFFGHPGIRIQILNTEKNTSKNKLLENMTHLALSRWATASQKELETLSTTSRADLFTSRPYHHY